MAWRLLLPTVLALSILPDRTQAVSIRDLLTSVKGDEGVRLDSREAADFLQSGPGRIRRHIKWYQQNPDFQSWYKYYQTIGHNEGLYEIDRIRLTYQHMRHLESVYGKDAPYYQHTLGMGPGPRKPKGPCDPQKDRGCMRPSLTVKGSVTPTPRPPPAHKGQHRPHAPISCNPQDPACLLQYVYRFLGPAQGGHPPSPPHEDQRDQEEEEEEEDEEEEEEEEDDEVDPYDPRYHGYYGDPRSYYGPNYPHGSPSKPKTNPYSSPNPYNPNPDPYNPYPNPYNPNPYNPNPNPYNSPNPNPYDSPRPYDSSNPYGSHNNYPYGNPYNSPYSAPYGSPYGSPYKRPYHEDEDEDDEY